MLRTRQLTLSLEHGSLYELIPEDHLLKRIAAVVNFSFANEKFADSYCRYYGRPAKEPELMLKLLFLQYLYDWSDEQVMDEVQVNLACKWFAGLNPEDRLPDPSVLSRFRTDRIAKTPESVQEILDAIVQQCVERGLIKEKRLIVDATHVEADTKMQRPLDVFRSMARKISRAMRKHHPDKVATLDELPETQQLTSSAAGEVLVAHLETVIRQVKDNVPTVKGPLADCLRKAEKLLADDKRLQTNGPSSEEDLDARVGRKSKEHLFFGYKSHVTMVEGDEIITACHVTAGNADDGKQLPSLVEQTERNGVHASELVADAAYGSKTNFTSLAAQEITAYIPVNGAAYTSLPDPRFTYNKDSDEMICPAGHPSYRRSRFKANNKTGQGGVTYFFNPKVCADCPLREGCYNGQKTGKCVTVSEPNAVQEAAKQRQHSEEGKAIYRRRGVIEHKIAELKRFCGLKRARYRSYLRVYLQAIMACVVANAKRMTKLAAPEAA